MSHEARKKAIREFKERTTPRGVFAVRCTVTGHAWVGCFPNLDAARNGLWFMLRNGGHDNKELQAEWNAQGEQAFTFEILEKLDEGVSPLAVSDVLKEKKNEWMAQLGARAI